MAVDERLGTKVFRAGLWATALRSSIYLLGLIRTIIIARLLAPEDLGLFGIAVLATATLEAFTDTGFREALIQREKTIQHHLPTAWTIQIARNTFVAALLVAAAPLVAGFFDEPMAAPLVGAAGIAVLLSGLENIGVVRFERHLRFGPHFQLNFAGLVADLAVSVGAAWVLRNPWALIYGLIAGKLVRTVASYLLSSYRPHLAIDRSAIRELYGYGVWVFLNRIVFFLALRADDIFVGRFLGAFALGIYQVAFQIGELAARELTSVVSSVAFPAFSRIQGDRGQVVSSYLVTTEAVASVVIPVAAVSIFLAEPLVLLVLGNRWAPVAVILPILIWSASIRGMVATSGGVFLALGKPRLSAQLNMVRVAVLLALLIPMARRFGLEGVAWAVLASVITTIPFVALYVHRMLAVGAGVLLEHLLPGTVLGCVSIVPFLTIQLLGWSGPIVVTCATVASVASYGIGVWAAYRYVGVGPLQALATLTGSGRGETVTRSTNEP